MRKPIAISELLAQGKAKLESLRSGADAASRVLAAVQRALPPELAPHVWSAAISDEDVLTLVTESGSWATRVRYVASVVAGAVGDELKREITRTVVRVRPRTGGGRPGSR
jgi:hypothetical protein